MALLPGEKNNQSQRKILWTNPNPNSSFEDQTVNFDMEGFEEFTIYCKFQVDTNFFTNAIAKKNMTVIISEMSRTASKAVKILRTATFQENKVVFDKGAKSNLNEDVANIVDNNCIIPFQIIGIK